VVVANKYTTLSRFALVAKPIVLILGHGTGHHKETWEPCVERLFELDGRGPKRLIAEIWSVDCQHHGEAAIVNSEYLAKNPFLPCEMYADAYLAVIQSGHIADITNRSIVLAGHSGGAAADCLVARGTPNDELPFSRIILVEPPMVPPELVPFEQFEQLVGMIGMAVKKRRETWPDRKSALEFLSKRKPWRLWTPKAIELFVEHALRPQPTAEEPDAVTLCVSNEVEIDIHKGIWAMYAALDRMSEIASHVPIHVIFGGKPDYRTQEIKDALCDPKHGRTMASIHTIKGAGHSVAQEKPIELSDVMYEIFKSSMAFPTAKL